MDAPKTRYRVIEKDGRLIVIDSQSGAPATSQIVLPPHQAGRPLQSSFIEAGPKPFDALAAALAKIAIRKRTPQGEAIVDWTWTVNRRQERWHVRLDRAQERVLGRALARFVPIAPVVFGIILPLGSVVRVVAVMALLPAIVLAGLGARTIKRLRSETAGQQTA